MAGTQQKVEASAFRRAAKAQADENAKLNLESYTKGLITHSDLLDAQAPFHLTNNQLTDCRGDYRISLVKCLLVTGR